MTIPFVRQFDFTCGRRDQASLLIQRVVADNPGPFTFTGTGTYIGDDRTQRRPWRSSIPVR